MTLCINPRCDKSQNSDNAQFCQSCGSELLLKQRYRALNVLGEGGFGKTYEVSDLGTPNKVLKVLINNSPKAVELFQREAEFLSSHDSLGIPKAEQGSYFIFQPHDEKTPVHCIVMEKVEGMNLRAYLKQLGHPIDSETAERWLRELALILQEVHEQGVLHRDIKPQNIIFKPDGRLALIDFGAVREGTGTEVATAAGGGTEVASHLAGGTSIVSAGYTAPEQMNGEARKQSDFYSLGRTFIFLLTGKEPSEIPYDADEDVLQWHKYAPQVESKLATLIDQMTSTLVRQRPANAQNILQDLEIQIPQKNQSQEQARSKDVNEEKKVPPTPQPTPSPKPKNSWRNRIAIGLVAAASSFVGRTLFSASTGLGTSTPPPVTIAQASCGFVSRGSNVRAAPNGQVLTKLSSGTFLTSTGARDGEWIEITTPVAGWIHSSRIADTCSGNSGL